MIDPIHWKLLRRAIAGKGSDRLSVGDTVDQRTLEAFAALFNEYVDWTSKLRNIHVPDWFESDERIRSGTATMLDRYVFEHLVPTGDDTTDEQQLFELRRMLSVVALNPPSGGELSTKAQLEKSNITYVIDVNSIKIQPNTKRLTYKYFHNMFGLIPNWQYGYVGNFKIVDGKLPTLDCDSIKIISLLFSAKDDIYALHVRMCVEFHAVHWCCVTVEMKEPRDEK